MSRLIDACGCYQQLASLLLATALLSGLSATAHSQEAAVAPVSAQEQAAYAELQPVLQQRCVLCHSSQPAIPAYPNAPAGVVLETPEQLRQFAPRVRAVTATTHSMPPDNLTAMTDAERQQLDQILRATWPQAN